MVLLMKSPPVTSMPHNRHRLISTYTSSSSSLVRHRVNNLISAKTSCSSPFKPQSQFSNVSITTQGARGCCGQNQSNAPTTIADEENNIGNGGERSYGNYYYRANNGNYKMQRSSIAVDNECTIQEEKASVSWINQYFPKKVQPYAHLARLDKPIGTWLLAWPAFWSIALASPSAGFGNYHLIFHELKLLAVFGYGAVLLRGAACTINDIFDRDIDKQVDRTKSRPLACGEVSVFQGYCFLGFQMLLWIPGFLLQLNPYSRILATCSLILYYLYPLMKRITYWPQAFLGLTFNTGAILGWSAVKGSIEPGIVFPLYLCGFFWTLVYDTIYAHQDKEDDLKVGVKSRALMFGDSTKKWISGFAIACIACLGLAGFNANLSWPFYAVLAFAAGHLAWQIFTVDLSIPSDCGSKFVSNKWFGAIVFLGMLCGRIRQWCPNNTALALSWESLESKDFLFVLGSNSALSSSLPSTCGFCLLSVIIAQRSTCATICGS